MEFHAIGHDHGVDATEVEARIGTLGAGLDMLARWLAIATPDGFVVDAACADELTSSGWTSEALAALESALHALEFGTNSSLGDPAAPLLLAVRGVSGTVLDLGINPANISGVAGAVGGAAAAQARLCGFLERFADVVVSADMAPFEASIAAAGALGGRDRTPALLQLLAQQHRRTLAERLPDSALEQLKAAIGSLAAAGPVVVQIMVHGAAAGSASSRDLLTGAAGTCLPEGFDDVADEVSVLLRQGEVHLRDVVEFDLVKRPDSIVVVGAAVGRRSGVAAARIAHALTLDGEIGLSRAEAVCRITPDHVEQILHQSFDQGATLEVLTKGLGVSPGAAVGRVVFNANDALAMASAGEPVILVARETSPEDVHGMEVSAGILTMRGGLASHAAVVARGWGIPAVCGAEEIILGDDVFSVGRTVVAKGEVISLDGATGDVMMGSAATSSSAAPAEFDEILAWADEIRSGHLGVRANADTGADATRAREFGAEGIGLCRTEHMFFGEGRLEIVRQMILASSPAKERAALNRLRLVQRDDFVEILEAMDGLPVTVRLLDPPLHEFLPDVEELAIADALGELDDAGRDVLAAARIWSEQNPMMGTRGVRLGWLKPGLYGMQVRALVEAVSERLAAGGDPIIEVMIPLTVSGPELAGACQWVHDAVEAQNMEPGRVTVGTMIETPRAALVAGQLAAHVDFFSLGTNDLTQLTYGFSRDDVETRIMSLYLDNALLPSNPFEHLDVDAVAELIKIAVVRGRAANPDLKIGICGEHGGDPASVAVCLDAGLDYVSCSPYRVPVARLAAAQAVTARSR